MRTLILNIYIFRINPLATATTLPTIYQLITASSHEVKEIICCHLESLSLSLSVGVSCF